VAGWLAVCHSRYCIKTTKPILKLFRPSDSLIIEAFGTRCVDTKFQGACHSRSLKGASSGALNTRRVGKIGDFREIFDGHRCLSRRPCSDSCHVTAPYKFSLFYYFLLLSRKRCEITRWLLWNVNRKSWVPDWMV